MYVLTKDRDYTFTDNQQWLDNNTYSVIAICDGEEYCVDYDVPSIPQGEEFQIDWEEPSRIWHLSDGAVVYSENGKEIKSIN